MKNDQSTSMHSAPTPRRGGPRAFFGSSRYVPAVLIASSVFGYLTFGCEPDLDSLSADFEENPNDGGTSGSGGTDG